MSSTNKTDNIKLSQFEETDTPTWLQDYNQDMKNIDEAIGNGGGLKTVWEGNIPFKKNAEVNILTTMGYALPVGTYLYTFKEMGKKDYAFTAIVCDRMKEGGLVTIFTGKHYNGTSDYFDAILYPKTNQPYIWKLSIAATTVGDTVSLVKVQELGLLEV